MDRNLTDRPAFPAEAIVFVIGLIGLALVAITLFAVTYVFPDTGGFLAPRVVSVDPGPPPDMPRAIPGP
jgi:hypothetical protein